MGQVLRYDQETWSTMRMVQEAKKWCDDNNRPGSAEEHKTVLKSLIHSADEEVA